MSDHGNQLREAFETQEDRIPDPAAVYARVQELSRTYRRRRRGVQAAGTAVLGVGLIAGAVQLPAVLSGNGSGGVAVVAGASPSPSVSASPSPAELQKRWDAYFTAGFDYDDAVTLAKLWHSTAEIGDVKAEAGRRLLAGETLPVKPDPKRAAEAKRGVDAQAFFTAGYTYKDAVKLAAQWHTKDAFAAKVEGGRRLLAGQTLPFAPNPRNVVAARESIDVDAFFNAGYSIPDAARLAALWKLTDPYQAKVEGGRRLLAGETLPITPSPPTPTAQEDERIKAYFDAGYDYNDAVKLAKKWKLADADAAKFVAGQRLLDGETLPIKP